MDNDVSCVFEGLGPIGALYVSNSKAASNMALLEKLNIKAVVTAAKGRKVEYPASVVPKYLYLEIEDCEDFNIERYFEMTFDFIQESRKFTNVLIHCHIGASRSVSIVMAYLIRKYHYSLPQIYTLIKRKRAKIEPNPGFVRQLQKYSEKYGIRQNEVEFSISKSKRKVQRSMSLLQTQKTLDFEFSQNQRQIKSEELKQNKGKPQNQQDLFKEERQKIQLLHRQRQEIEYKLRNLRHGLIKGNEMMKKRQKMGPQMNSTVEFRAVDISDKNENIENSNPNIELSTSKIINLLNPKISTCVKSFSNEVKVTDRYSKRTFMFGRKNDSFSTFGDRRNFEVGQKPGHS